MRRPLLIAIVVLLVAAAGYATARLRRDFWDFEVIRTAGTRVMAAEPLYRPDDGHYQYKYWPVFAVAMVPFGAIPLEAGKVVWFALTVALIATFIRMSIVALPDRRLSTVVLTWWVLLLTGKFLVKELVNGQTNALLGVLVMLALRAVETGRPLRAGAFVACAAFAKPYAVLFIPWLLAASGVRAALAALAGLAAGLVAPALVYGWNGNLTLLADWYRTVSETTSPNLLFPENISLASMYAKWVGTGPTAFYLAGLSAAILVGLAAVVWRRGRTVNRPAFLDTSYLLLIVPLLSPQGWDYVLLLGTPAIILLVDRFRERPIDWRLMTAAGLLLTSFTIYDLLGRGPYLWLMSVSAISVGAILLAIGLARLRLTAAA
jgi:hypothetical protein